MAKLVTGLEKPRLPKDYPWKILHACMMDISTIAHQAPDSDLERIIRNRSVKDLEAWTASNDLQSIVNDVDRRPPHIVAGQRLLCCLLKKFPFPEVSSEERRNAALHIVKTCDAECRVSNRKLRYLMDPSSHPSVITYARSFIEQVLGDFQTNYEIGELDQQARHGPGSSTSSSHGLVNTYFKYSEYPYDVTTRGVPHARSLIWKDKRWLGALEERYRRDNAISPWSILNWDTFFSKVLSIRDTNRITTVPKDGRKDRPIAIEPDINVMLQLGLDHHIRRRLKRWGIDLNLQEDNQIFARRGSMGNNPRRPSTIDLSSASDLISLRLLKVLLPSDWYQYMLDLRSPKGIYPDGSETRYNRYASMGNGTTFAVESLIFASIAQGVAKTIEKSFSHNEIRVFGDDIIVPGTHARYVCQCLEHLGLQVNWTKSFLHGNVRESCGSDWYFGWNIRPIFLKAPLETVPDIMIIRNQLNRWFVHHMEQQPEAVNSLLENWIPSEHRLQGPYSDEEFGSYLHSSSPPRSIWSNGRYEYRAIMPVQKRYNARKFLFRNLLASLSPHSRPLNRWDAKPSSGSVFDVTLRRCVGYRIIRRTTPDWCSSYRSLTTMWRSPEKEIPTPS